MSGRLRIALVSDCYPPRVGGIESQVSDLAAAHAREGHDVHVLTATADPRRPDGGRRGTTLERGVHVHRYASRLTFGLPTHPLPGTVLRRALGQLRPDVVHVQAGVVSPFAYGGATAARRLGLPLAITWHSMLTGAGRLMRPVVRLTGWRRAAVALSAVSRVAADRVADVFGQEPGAVHVVPNGIDVAAWAPTPSAPEPAAGPPPLRVVATLRLAPRKRAVPLVRVLAAAHERLGRTRDGAPRITLDVFGTGPAAASVRREVGRTGLTDVVTLRGRVERATLAQHYADAHAFLVAARLEAFGIAALEARAAGLAVIAGAGTGVSEFVVDGVDGLLTTERAEGGDHDAALTDALVRLATQHDLLGRILRHNREQAPASDWSDVLAAATDLYSRARSLRAS